MPKQLVFPTLLAIGSLIGSLAFWTVSREAHSISYGNPTELIATSFALIYAFVSLFAIVYIRKSGKSQQPKGLNPLISYVGASLWLALPLCVWALMFYSSVLHKEALAKLNSPDQSRKKLIQGADLYKMLFGQQGFNYRLQGYADAAYSRKAYIETEWALQNLLEHPPTAGREPDWRVLHALQRLGQINLEQRRFNHALEYFKQLESNVSHADTQQMPEAWQRNYAFFAEIAVSGIARSYLQMGNQEQAVPYLLRQISMEEAHYGKWPTLGAKEALLDSYFALKKYSDAEKVAREVIALRESEYKQNPKISSRDAADLARSYEVLARILRYLGKNDEAALIEAKNSASSPEGN